jgi:hypothetical protein
MAVHARSLIGSLKEACWFLLGPAPIRFGGAGPAKDCISGGRYAARARWWFLPFPFRPLPLAGKGKRGVARAARTNRRGVAAGRVRRAQKTLARLADAYYHCRKQR